MAITVEVTPPSETSVTIGSSNAITVDLVAGTTRVLEVTTSTPTAVNYRSLVTGGTGVTYSANNGIINIGQDVATTATPTFAAATINGAIGGVTTLTASGEIEGGSLDINGNASIAGAVTDVTTLTASSATLTNNLNVNTVNATGVLCTGIVRGGSLDINGAASIAGAVTDVTTLTASGEIEGGSLDINGNASIAGAVTDVTTLTASGEIEGGSLDINGIADISGNAQIADLRIVGAQLGHALDVDLLTFSVNQATVAGTLVATGLDINGNADISGNLTGVDTLTATTFSGSGASLTNLPAGQLTGTIDDARIPSGITRDSELTAHTSLTNNPHSVTAAQVSLGNVTNESKATMFSSPTFTGTVAGVTATHVGLGNVTNESKATMFTGPTFTGNPQSNAAPSSGGHLTNKTYVDAQVAGIVDGAPGTLNTLNEIAIALNNDAALNTTLTNSIGEKLVIASNLSDLANAGTARTNLGLGTAATTDATAYATAAQGTKADNALPLAGGQMAGNITFSGTQTVDGRDLSADGTRLDTMEDNADVTDTANVTAAGALMDSELTDLAGVKALDTSTLQVKPSEGAFADGDKTKLNNIEASADVTDTANVTAAGALMDSEVTNLAQVKAFNASDYVAASAVSIFGGTLIDDADAGAARTTLGLGTAATTASTAYAPAAGSSSITTVGTLTALTVDNIAIDGTTIGHTGDTDILSFANAEPRLTVNARAMEIVDTDSGTDTGPTISLYRNSSGPADGDHLGRIIFMGEDDAGDKSYYGQISCEVTTSGSSGVEQTRPNGQLKFTIPIGSSGSSSAGDESILTDHDDFTNDASMIYNSSGLTVSGGTVGLMLGSSGQGIRFEGSNLGEGSSSYENFLRQQEPTQESVNSGDNHSYQMLPRGSGVLLRSRGSKQVPDGSGNPIGIDVSAETVIFTTAHGLRTGDQVVYNDAYSTSLEIDNIDADSQTFYAIYVNDTTIKLASTLANALAGTNLNLGGTSSSDEGGDNQSFLFPHQMDNPIQMRDQVFEVGHKTTTERDALAAPTKFNGALIYNDTTNELNAVISDGWKALVTRDSGSTRGVTASQTHNLQSSATEDMSGHIGQKTIKTGATAATYTFPEITDGSSSSVDDRGDTWTVVNAGTADITCNRTGSTVFMKLVSGSDPASATSVTIAKGGVAEFVATEAGKISVFGSGIS